MENWRNKFTCLFEISIGIDNVYLLVTGVHYYLRAAIVKEFAIVLIQYCFINLCIVFEFIFI